VTREVTDETVNLTKVGKSRQANEVKMPTMVTEQVTPKTQVKAECETQQSDKRRSATNSEKARGRPPKGSPGTN
jgi:hypothetical protein